jgi:hypothetical protein
MFAAGMVAFAVESLLVDRLLSYPLTPEGQAFWILALQTATLLTPIPWCLFAFLAGSGADASVPRNWRISFAVGGAGLVVAALAALAWPFFSETVGVLWHRLLLASCCAPRPSLADHVMGTGPEGASAAGNLVLTILSPSASSSSPPAARKGRPTSSGTSPT